MTDTKNYTSSTLEGMTVKDLVAHALSEFNVEIDPSTMVKQKIVGYVLALQDLRESGVSVETSAGGGSTVETQDDPVVQEDEANEIVRQANERRVKVMFHSSQEPGGNMPIKMGLNGRAYVVKRDVEVSIPESVFNGCIRDAVSTVYEHVKDPQTNVSVAGAPRDVQRFSFSVLGYENAKAA